MDEKIKKVKELLKKYDQEQLLVCYETLSSEDKEKLLDQILSIDFDLMQTLHQNVNKTIQLGNDTIGSIDYIDKSKLDKQQYVSYETTGKQVIKGAKLAAVTMAGGQGTRLGYSGPKGTFDIGLASHKSLFELLCDSLKKAREEYHVSIPWYIMTSHENNQETVDFFEQHDYFNYPKEDIRFFIQGELPMLSTAGKILVDEKGFVKLAADGHGGVFEAMLKSGVIEDMKKRDIEWVFVGPVDNPLVNMVDPVFIGIAQSKHCMAAGKSVVKANPEERVGVFCTRNGKPSVIEYTEITEEMAHQTDENGELLYGESHLNCNMFNIQRIDKIAQTKLPYHCAVKKANYMNEKGEKVVAEKPNAYKFESFIFDAFSSLDSMAVMRVRREDEFAPVKNAEGVDSPKTARELYTKFHKI